MLTQDINSSDDAITDALNNKADRDLGNITSTAGLAQFAGIDLSNTGQLTNCVLSAGVNIQLDYDDTTLTLKAGSKLIKPDGSYVTSLYDQYADLSAGDNRTLLLVFYENDEGGEYHRWSTSDCSSSTTNPTAQQIYHYNYETKQFWFRGNILPDATIPFAQVTVANGKITEVVKLDTASYFGDCRFRLPLTALLADGFNEDGTSKVVKKTFDNVFQRNINNGGRAVLLESGGLDIDPTFYYNESTGFITGSVLKTESAVLLDTSYTHNGSVITSISPVHPIRIADANVIAKLEGNLVHIPVMISADATTLQIGREYSLNVTGGKTFVLPTPVSGKTNTITADLYSSGNHTVNWGTTKFFNKTTPDLEAGNYSVIWDYSFKDTSWVCGVIPKGVE